MKTITLVTIVLDDIPLKDKVPFLIKNNGYKNEQALHHTMYLSGYMTDVDRAINPNNLEYVHLDSSHVDTLTFMLTTHPIYRYNIEKIIEISEYAFKHDYDIYYHTI